MNDKQKFILKAVIGCLLVANRSGFALSMNAAFIYPLREFVDYFSIILIFWLIIPAQQVPQKWLLAGLLGSLIFSLGFLLFLFFITMNNFFPVSKISDLLLAEQTIFGFLGSIPLTLALRKRSKKAYLLPLATGVGFGLTYLPSFLLEISSIQTKIFNAENIITGHLFRFLVTEFSTYLGYGLLGLLLGTSIYHLIINDGEEKVIAT